MKPLTIAIAAVLCAPGQAQWSTANLSEARTELAATTVGALAMFAGGHNVQGRTAIVDVFDSRDGTWSTDSLSTAKSSMAAASASGFAYFTGTGGLYTDVYDVATGNWSTRGNPGIARRAAASTDTKVLFGGGGTYFNEAPYVYIYEAATGALNVPSLSQERFGLAATNVGDIVLFAGGTYSASSTPDHTDLIDVRDTQTDTWSTDALSQGRSFLAATTVAGKALFAGGNRGYSTPSSRVDIYDGASGTWSQAELSQARWDLCATSTDRYAFFAGGAGVGGDPAAKSDRVDIYDSLTDTWSTATLSVARSKVAATSVGTTALFGGGEIGPNWYSAVVDVFSEPFGTEYCAPTTPNSSGLAGNLWALGSASVPTNNVTVVAQQLPPGQFGYFITGLTQGLIQPPGSQGAICLSGNIGRYNRPGEIIQGPSASLLIDLSSMPVNPPTAALPGDTWNFQCWYRDMNPGQTSNTTNGLALTFATDGDPALQFAVTQGSIVEDTTQVEVRLTLSQPTNEDVLVSYAAGGTADVDVDWRVEEPNPFVIPAGDTRVDMTLVIAEDGQQEPDELAIVSLGAPVGAVLGTATTFTLTIVDDD